MIITLANQKGGTGKTTLATNLAGTFAAQERRVVLVDTDPQQSALEWREMRPDTRPHVTVVYMRAADGVLERDLTPLSQQYDVVLVDTGGRIAPPVRSAVAVADFILVPTLPSRPDIVSTEAFYRQVIQEVSQRKAVYGGIVLNGVQARTLLSREAAAYLRERNLPLFEACLHQYAAFREAIGRGLTVREYDPGGKAAKDMTAVYNELVEVLA
jgi:chromosome partitioning protein